MASFNPIGQDPFHIFDAWMQDAQKAEPNNPNAMCLSTVDREGRPSSRMVLLKEYDNDGFVFYTNSLSRKGHDLEHNSYVALNFYWKTFQRQVRVEGRAELVPHAMTEAYFQSRPRGSQIASYASDQSRRLTNKSLYEDRIRAIEKEFDGVETIPCPDHWNGYRVVPSMIELWVEGEFRTHDRFVFTQDNTGTWTAERLYP